MMADIAGPQLLVACAAYFVGCASPGPSVLAIMATALHQGRRAALAFALGVVTGATAWALLVAFGFAAVLARYASVLVVLKVVGGLYLLWLAYGAARSALSPRGSASPGLSACTPAWRAQYVRGTLFHLTNPKAVLVWVSIVALGMPEGGGWQAALIVNAACLAIGLGVFCGYAIAFSTRRAREAYARSRRGIDGVIAALFGYAGLRLLALRG